MKKNSSITLIISFLLLLMGIGSYAWLNFFLLEKYIYNLHFQNPLEPTIFVIGRSAKLKLIAIGLISFLLSFFSLAHSQLNKYLLISYLICILEEINPENAQKESKTGFSFKYVCQK